MMDERYFSGRLKKRLALIGRGGLTMIEAPAGYGKTTAVLWQMDRIDEGEVRWFTAVSFDQDASLDWFVHQIGLLDEGAGRAMKDLGFLNRSNVRDAACILDDMKVDEPVYLIFDNFQIIRDNWPPLLLRTLADRQDDGLHVIFISQDFGKMKTALENCGSVIRLEEDDFLLERDDIREYAGTLGLDLTEKETDMVYRNTEGWLAAVSMCLEQLKEDRDDIKEFSDMDGLLYEFFWSRLTPEGQELLLRASVFDCLRAEMLPLIAPGREDDLRNVLVRSPLIYRDMRKRAGYPHELLSSFLMKRLEEREEDFRSDVYEKAGDIYLSQGRTKKAVEFYFLAGRDDRLLSCELTGLLNETFGTRSYTQMAGDVLRRCGREVLSEHPLSMLRLCLALYGGCDFQGYEKALAMSRDIIEEKKDGQLLGEWHLVAAFRGFPDTKAMKEEYLRAAEVMTGQSEIFTPKEPFMFGTTSMWYLFYRTPGKMMETADDLKDMMEVYDSLTGNHGAGAYELYLSEALSVQGRFEESDLEANRAAMKAEQWQNPSVTYGVALVLGINAIYQSDMISLQKAIEYLETKALAYPFMQHTALNTLMADTVRTYLLGLMMEPDRSAGWARGTADILGDLTFTTFMGKTNRITDLILHKEYKRAIASVEESLKLDPRLISLSTRNFMCVGLALCYLAIGSISRAAEWLEESLTMAEKDRNYTFIACFRKYLSVLFLKPSIKRGHEKAIREIKALDIHYTKAEETHIFYMLEKDPSSMDELTEREKEVAKLAAEGLRNKEIAERLFISNETVKSHIRSIFMKMNIDRRSRLVELLK